METLSNLFYQVIPFLLIITILITVHEFGHYIAARYYKVAIHTFSIGFGTSIWKKIDKNGVTWQICMLPLGGYVRMASLDLLDIKKELGEITPERYEQLKKLTMEGQTTIGRVIIAAAGPIANIIFSFVVMTGLFMYGDTATKIRCVVPESPAADAGLKKGDILLPLPQNADFPLGYVAGKPNEFSALLLEDSNKKLVSFPKREVDFKACDGLYDKSKKYAGITQEIEVSRTLKLGFIDSTIKSIKNIKKYFSQSFQSLVGLLGIKNNILNAENSVGGVIAIQQMTAQISQISFWHTILFSASLSLALAFFNLLPIPILDGGHILFAIIEGVARKRLSRKIRSIITFIGLAFILFLFIVLVNIDLLRILT